MTVASPAATSLCLPLIASSRLGPSALQSRLDEMDMGQTLMPCGGMTRHQIDGASFGSLADLAARWRRIWRRRAAGYAHDG